MAAGLHRDFVMVALDNAFATPGGMRVLGTEADWGRSTWTPTSSPDRMVTAGSLRPTRRTPPSGRPRPSPPRQIAQALATPELAPGLPERPVASLV
jgi:hypothetical protein